MSDHTHPEVAGTGTPADPHVHDESCAVAHGTAPGTSPNDRVLVAVYDTPLAGFLLRWGTELGFHTILLDPDRADQGGTSTADDGPPTVAHAADVPVDGGTHVVVTDHHRDDLGPVLAELVTARPRWIGIIGSPRHAGPHVEALRAEGVDDELIATVRRPIGVDIGSKTPPEIALSVLAGLLADHNGRDGGLPPMPSLAEAAR